VILWVDDAVDAAACLQLIETYDRLSSHARHTDGSGFPVLHWPEFNSDAQAAAVAQTLVAYCLSRIKDQWPSWDLLYPETVLLAMMSVGGRHSKHADNCRQSADGCWVPNHTPQRDVSAIFYLNDAFEGGELFFEGLGLTIRPKRGLMVAFPSDAEHVHEVKPVRTGVRYTLAIWFTKQERRALSLGRQ
jgi:predicted 2-oxoglutarate/Fe(II)-dependent dioxygenase YbiX